MAGPRHSGDPKEAPLVPTEEESVELDLGLVLFASIPFFVFASILLLIIEAEDAPLLDFIGNNVCLVTMVVGSLFLPLVIIATSRRAETNVNAWLAIAFLFLIPWMLGIGAVLSAAGDEDLMGMVVGMSFAIFFFSFPFFVIYIIQRRM